MELKLDKTTKILLGVIALCLFLNASNVFISDAHAKAKKISQEQLKEYFSKHRVGSSPDYAVVKNGDDYLFTIHSYRDDKATCEEVIKPYNDDPKLSIVKGSYECVRLND